MRTATLALPTAILLLLLLPALPAEVPVAPPSGAILTAHDGIATVQWQPAAVTPESYVVYGENADGIVTLAETTGLAATAPAGYATYYVAARDADQESVRVAAIPLPCVYTNSAPPYVEFEMDCRHIAARVVGYRLP